MLDTHPYAPHGLDDLGSSVGSWHLLPANKLQWKNFKLLLFVDCSNKKFNKLVAASEIPQNICQKCAAIKYI